MSGQASPSALPLQTLHDELRQLIAAGRQRLAATVNAELTLLYWRIGQRLSSEVLGSERAQYGAQLMDRLGERLAGEFGRGFETKNLRRMVQFAQAFPDGAIVATLSRQLSWSHIVALLPLKSVEARQHYAEQANLARWSVRELRQQIERKAYERHVIASIQAPDENTNACTWRYWRHENSWRGGAYCWRRLTMNNLARSWAGRPDRQKKEPLMACLYLFPCLRTSVVQLHFSG